MKGDFEGHRKQATVKEIWRKGMMGSPQKTGEAGRERWEGHRRQGEEEGKDGKGTGDGVQ